MLKLSLTATGAALNVCTVTSSAVMMEGVAAVHMSRLMAPLVYAGTESNAASATLMYCVPSSEI
jgi:hypothetical protein